jgi:predicted ATPase
LAPVRETSFIVPAIGKALSFRFQGAREPKEQLLDYLQSRQTLLLVDNFEHLLSDVDLLSEILGSAPGVKILATSRERLNLREEWVYEVRGMPYPSEFDPKQMERETSLQEYSAIRLFIQYARQADASRPVPADELPHVVHLCQLLDGLPLGLELAASWVRSMTVQEITAEVASNLDFLSTTLRNVPERQRSLRAIFVQTWQRLSRDEQSVMANLSVFRGGCRQEAAEKVAGATLIALDSLVEKALLHRSQDGRYDMHEMIRQFASEQLRQHITAYESTLDWHSAYYAAFLQRLEDDTVGWNMLNTLKIIGEEIDNISAALDWAVTQKDAAVFEQAAESLVQYWPYPSLERQGEFIIEQAVTALTGSAERGIGVHYPRLAPKLRPLVGFLIAMQGFLVARMGEPGAAQPLLEQGVALQEPSTSRHKRRLAKSKYHLGWTLCSQGNFQKAMSELREALALFSDVQYPHGMAWCLVHLGRVSYQSGQIEEANRFFVKSRELSDK